MDGLRTGRWLNIKLINLNSISKIAIIAGLVAALCLIVLIWPDKSIEWHEGAGYRWSELPSLESGQPGFELLPSSKTEITFSNKLTPEQIADNRFLLGGSGVATGDVDGDGLIDVYFNCLDCPNVLYKNLGDWKFKDITKQAGVACPDRFSTGVALVDIDGDFDLDLIVTSLGGPNACYVNDGFGNFTEVTDAAGLKSSGGSTSMAYADIDGDGDIDLYMTNFKKKSVENLYSPQERTQNLVAKKVGGTYEITPKFKEHYRVETNGDRHILIENAEPDFLYLNDGKGHFEKASFTDGRFLDESGNPISELKDWGLLPRFQDMDNDGDPDIYVCNDYSSPDRIWINDGTGRFQAIEKLAIRHTSKFTMAMNFSDIDRDGDLDFILIDMLARNYQRRMQQTNTTKTPPTAIGQINNRPQIKRNTLFVNRGDNTYAEIGQLSGVQASEWTWSVIFVDVDLDGYEDIITTNGQLYDFEDTDTNNRVQGLSAFGYDYRQMTALYPSYLTPNVAFRNKGDLTFEDVSSSWGFTNPDLTWGMALADFDNDGDLDLATNRLNEAAGIYENKSGAPRIAVRLRGLSPNTQGIGAKIRVLGGPVPQAKEVTCGGIYLSSSDPMVTFAAGSAENLLTIEVVWRSGKVSEIKNVKPNCIYEIFEAYAKIDDSSSPDSSIAPSFYFEDVSNLINHKHHEDTFDDFSRQPLLPKRLSQVGPGVAWYDIDGDKDDDLIISSGKGGQLAFYRNDGKQGFTRIQDTRLVQKTQFDQTSVLGWTKDNSSTFVLVGFSNYESLQPANSFIMSYDFERKTFANSTKVIGNGSSLGPMAMADYDDDGDLDLFVGGRTVPGRYPEPASSILYKNDNGRFTIDEKNSKQFKFLGMVSGAVFSDIDGNGSSDLILAVEWGSVMVFRNQNGHFTNATNDLGLDRYKGWWNGVTTGDLDEDGYLDIIATNWGLNNEYSASFEHPLRIYYDDFDGNGTLDIIEAHFDPVMNQVIPRRDLTTLSQAIPYVRPRTPNYKRFSAASVDDIIGESLKQAHQLIASELRHMVFLNRKDHFEAVALPIEAQFTPAFYVGVADFNGDGHDDVFISQNFFPTILEKDRGDAGRGLWLKGDGTGKLEVVPGQVSGIKVYGEQRGAALGDFNHDGRVDLVITQNGAETKLYRNIGAKPGLRVRLNGPKGNPYGIGSIIRMEYINGFGPAREIHAGSGYLSQNSVVQVMGLRDNPKGVWVRWPNGKITQTPLIGNPTEILISYKL